MFSLLVLWLIWHFYAIQVIEDVLALFQTLPEADRALLLSGNSKISTTNLKLTPAQIAIVPIPTKPIIEPHESTLSQPTAPSVPGTPSSSLKRKHVETTDENSRDQEPEDLDSPAKALKSMGRPKKPVDPEKAAKVRGMRPCACGKTQIIYSSRRKRGWRRSSRKLRERRRIRKPRASLGISWPASLARRSLRSPAVPA